MKNAAEMALAEFNEPEHPAAGEGRRRHAARRAAGRAAGARRRRRDHHRSAVRAIGQRGRPGRARAQHSGDRVLDRRQRRRARRLSAELPAGVRRRAHRRLRRLAGQALVRGAAAGQCLWRGGRGGVPAGGRAARRPRRGAGAISARSGQDGRADPARGAGGEPASTRSSFPTAPTRCRRWCRRSPPAASTSSACNCSAPACGTIRASSRPRRSKAAGIAAPESTGFRNFSGRYRARYGQDPVRTATLAYDAVALVAALVKTQGAQRFSEQMLTNSVRLCRHRRRVPLPPRRHQRARPCGAARRAVAAARSISPAPRVVRTGVVRIAEAGHRSHAARSATTASSTGNPAGVTRRRPSAVVSTAPSSRKNRNPPRIERAAGERRVARRIDAFGEPQSHQQKFVGHFARRQRLVDDEAVAVRLDAHQPGFRPLLGLGGVAAAVDVEPAMRARTDAGIFVAAPVDQIVPALGAGPRVVGNLVGRQAGAGADLLRQIVEIARQIVVGNRRACRPCAGRRTACPARW